MPSGGRTRGICCGARSAAVRHLEEMAPRLEHRSAAGRSRPWRWMRCLGDELLAGPATVRGSGVVLEGESHLDRDQQRRRRCGDERAGTTLMSGSSNTGRAAHLRATAPARERQYARIVELVRTAQGSKAPIQRVADRYAVWFTPITLALCAATWLVTHDSARVLAVLVVATPCPLLLAAPVAIIGGVNRAARDGIIVRSGAALEQLSTVDFVVLDKTGTLTMGRRRYRRARGAGLWPHRRAAPRRSGRGGIGRTCSRAACTRPRRQTECSTGTGPGGGGAGRGIRGVVGRARRRRGERGYVAVSHPGRPRIQSLDDGSSGLRAGHRGRRGRRDHRVAPTRRAPTSPPRWTGCAARASPVSSCSRATTRTT